MHSTETTLIVDLLDRTLEYRAGSEVKRATLPDRDFGSVDLASAMLSVLERASAKSDAEHNWWIVRQPEYAYDSGNYPTQFELTLVTNNPREEWDTYLRVTTDGHLTVGVGVHQGESETITAGGNDDRLDVLTSNLEQCVEWGAREGYVATEPWLIRALKTQEGLELEARARATYMPPPQWSPTWD
ncbi:hypothetical protein ACFQNE_02800 [Gordonia phosphorivorans]|uniref:Uncharacterized protein n=1 Tax=Gordonia phosphorivorans TaxID=1056982 RepID=A0ABV6H446_9ACTN